MTTVQATTARALTTRLAAAQRDGRLPSLVAGVSREGERVWSGTRGDHTGGAAAGLDLQYRMGSITKTFTAVLVLRLVRDGRLDLDAPVGRLLGDVGYADRTARSLLAHSSGMQSEPVGPWWERSPGVSWEELVAANDGTRSALPALQQFHYSNLGYALLGRMVETQLGQPWWDAVRERILTPLGMHRTSYLPQQPAAEGYSVHPYAGTLHPEPATDTGAMAPAGQLWSTVDDLLIYAGFLIEGHPDVLPVEDLLSASHPQSGDQRHAFAMSQGLGFMLLPGGSGLLVGHGGSMPGFLAGLLIDRDRCAAGVVLANGTTGVPMLSLARDLLEVLEEHEPRIGPPWTPTEQVPTEVEEVLGVWHWGNTPFEFGLEEGRVVARRQGQEQYAFTVRDGAVIGTSGYHAGERLWVRRAADGTVSHLEIATFVFTREPSS